MMQLTLARNAMEVIDVIEVRKMCGMWHESKWIEVGRCNYPTLIQIEIYIYIFKVCKVMRID